MTTTAELSALQMAAGEAFAWAALIAVWVAKTACSPLGKEPSVRQLDHGQLLDCGKTSR